MLFHKYLVIPEECRNHHNAKVKYIYNKAIQHNDPHIQTCHHLLNYIRDYETLEYSIQNRVQLTL